MSSWRFDAKIDISKLLALSQKLNNIPAGMFEVAEDVAIDVKENIVRQGVVDTGALLSSITAEQRGDDITVVRDGVEYGIYNEFGTHKMAARPFFMPAIEHYGELFDRVFTRLLR